MKCINCYRKIDENLKFCNFCGAKQPVDREAYEREHPELANALPEEELLEQKQEHQRQIMELKLRQEELERQIRQVTEHLEQEQKTTVAQSNVAATIATTSSEDVKAATGQHNAAVNESVERERSAMGDTGYKFPRKAVVINTSPSSPEKNSAAQKQTEESKMPRVEDPGPVDTKDSAHKPIYPRDKRIFFLAIGIAIGLIIGAGLAYYFSNNEEKIIYGQTENQDDAIIEDSENVILEDSIEDLNKSMPRMDRGNASQQEAESQAVEDRAVEQARQAVQEAASRRQDDSQARQTARQTRHDNQRTAAQQQNRKHRQQQQQRQQQQRAQQKPDGSAAATANTPSSPANTIRRQGQQGKQQGQPVQLVNNAHQFDLD